MGVTGVTYPRAMTASLDTPYSGAGLARTLAAFRSTARMDMAFGGRVLPAGNRLEITGMCGARTQALANLVVRSGAGLGGKALTLGRPVSVMHYYTAQGITHVYDHAVRQEHLETVVALPVLVEKVPRLVVYVANRAQVGLGDRWFDQFTPLMRRLERDIAVNDEVRRRLHEVSSPEPADRGALSRDDLSDIVRELDELAALIQDDELRARVEHVRSRVQSGEAPQQARGPAVALAPREIAVLAQVSHGLSNREAAEALGLVESTVKSYLKVAMRKLGAANRVQAITAARAAGVLD